VDEDTAVAHMPAGQFGPVRVKSLNKLQEKGTRDQNNMR
jgi:hypothetical protein